MPPKKKGKSDDKTDGKKKGKKDAKKEVIGPPPPEPIDKGSEEFYLIQICDLERRIERYQKKCDELEVRNGEYKKKFDQLIQDKEDIVLFIKNKLDEKTDEITEVNGQLMSLQQAKDSEKDGFEQQLQQLQSEYQETKDQLTSENLMLGGKLASLEEFKTQREELMEKMDDLQQELYELDRMHKENVYTLERKQVIDKDRLKKEMIQRVNQIAAEFRKVSNQQMAETTKRVIQENVAINNQLSKISEKTMEIVGENDGLREKEQRQRQQIEILEANEKELAKKNLSNQRIIRMLTDKCRAQEQALLDFEVRKEQYKMLETEVDLLRHQLENTRTEIYFVSEENREFESELGRTRVVLEERIMLRHRLEKMIHEAVCALQEVLHDSAAEDCSESEFDIMTKRKMVIQNLVQLLNSSLELEKGREKDDLEAESDLHECKSLSDPVGRYQLGDLGLIPRPEQHIPTSLDKLRQLETSRLNAFNKVVNKSIGTQTVSTAKVMFVADQLIDKFPPAKDSHRSLRNSATSTPNTLPPVIPSSSNQMLQGGCTLLNIC